MITYFAHPRSSARSQQGAILLVGLVFILVLATIGLYAMNQAVLNQRSVGIQQDRTQADFTIDGKLAEVANQLKEQINNRRGSMAILLSSQFLAEMELSTTDIGNIQLTCQNIGNLNHTSTHTVLSKLQQVIHKNAKRLTHTAWSNENIYYNVIQVPAICRPLASSGQELKQKPEYYWLILQRKSPDASQNDPATATYVSSLMLWRE